MTAGIQASPLELVTCAICGNRFDPAESGSCAACPLGGGCALVCCPACGYQMPDPKRSRLVALGSWIAQRRPRRRRRSAGAQATSLADVAPGSRVRIDALDGLSDDRRHQLQAYGLAPGRWVKVVQHSPVTVIRVEHLDLAFESEIARGISVEAAAPYSAEKSRGRRFKP